MGMLKSDKIANGQNSMELSARRQFVCYFMAYCECVVM